MSKIRAVIVDDEGLARDTLQLLLDTHDDIEIVAVCENGQQAVETIEATAPDLVFLDIQMPVMNGFEVVETVGPAKMPVVIFVTAYDQYALRAFEAQALDYLLKPFDDERFEQALERAREMIRQQQVGQLGARLAALVAGDQPVSAPAADSATPYLQRIMIKSRQSMYFLRVEDVDWIEAAGDYVSIHVDGKPHLLRETMSGMLEKLNPTQFVRIHRSSIVRIDSISEVKPYFHGDYIILLKSGKELKLSRRYWESVEKVLKS